MCQLVCYDGIVVDEGLCDGVDFVVLCSIRMFENYVKDEVFLGYECKGWYQGVQDFVDVFWWFYQFYFIQKGMDFVIYQVIYQCVFVFEMGKECVFCDVCIFYYVFNVQCFVVCVFDVVLCGFDEFCVGFKGVCLDGYSCGVIEKVILVKFRY